MDAEALRDRLVTVFKALGDLTRLRILGALAERPRTGVELAELLGLGAPTVSHHMARLTSAGLVTVRRQGQHRLYELDGRELAALARAAARQSAAREASGVLHAASMATTDQEARERAKVIRDFFDGDRLKQIPAQRKKRVIVLQHLMHWFDPERSYAEREVNDILRRAHEDVATLRRELVDYGYLTRAAGIYRVARSLPQRDAHIAQEMTGNEQEWLRRLLRATQGTS
jgi:biotin operon repressor